MRSRARRALSTTLARLAHLVDLAPSALVASFAATALAFAVVVAAGGCGDDRFSRLDVRTGDNVSVSGGFTRGRRGFALAPSSAGGFSLVAVENVCEGGCEGRPNDRVSRSRYAADLSLVSGPAGMAEASLDSRLFLAACARDDGSLEAAWSSLRYLSEGVNLDTADVEVAGDDLAPFVANRDTVGSQSRPHVACLGGGRLAVTWESRCGAVRRTGNVFVHFRPEECDAAPDDGVYLQLFDATGAAAGPTHAVAHAADAVADEAGVAPLPGGGLLLVAGGLVQVRDADGEIVDETMFDDGPVEDPLVSCSSEGLCAVVWGAQGVHARLVDVRSLEGARDLTIADVDVAQAGGGASAADPAYTLPLEPGLACDAEGVCLVTWRSVRETTGGDFTDVEQIGIFARALDARTGELGPAASIAPPEQLGHDTTGPALVAVGAGAFVAARADGGSIALQRLEVR